MYLRDSGSNSRTKSNIPFSPVSSNIGRSESPEPVTQSVIEFMVMSRPPSLRRYLEVLTSVPSPQVAGQSPTIDATDVPSAGGGNGAAHEEVELCGLN